ncbi:MAG: AMP-binding protein [Gammaproteobacteria bacterium]|nr:AMP-binding protein [Gammaproteobacteria bacterium]
MNAKGRTEAQTQSQQMAADRMLALIEGLLRESASHAQAAEHLTLDSSMERDLGLDSLSLTELLTRVEDEFGVALPDRALLAESPRALLELLNAARGEPSGLVNEPTPLPGETDRQAPEGSSTLIQVLDWHLQAHPDRLHILLYGDEDEPESISYADLWQGACRMAAGLQTRGVEAGDRVAIMLPTGRGYFFSFYGILLAGAVPVPIYPPARPSQLEEHLRRHGRILANAGTRILISLPEAQGVARLLQAQAGTLQHILDWRALLGTDSYHSPVTRSAGNLAFLQYTSGSTGDPKGVMLTHAQLLANIRAMGKAVDATSSDVFISWLPLYHDMGLIGAWLGSLYFGIPLVAMSPLRFLARPSRWLRAIQRHHGTLSAAPNFGYELCLTKIRPEEIEGLDLSSWRWAFNGAEPVNAVTLERFTRRFAPYGLRAKVQAPVYGLAEAAVGLAFPPPGRGPRIDRIQREPFMTDGTAIPAEGESDSLSQVACGQPLEGYQIRVVDQHGQPLPERQEGRLEFQGPSATRGYFNNPQATRELIHAGWLDTGDRGYLAAGEIFVTGRIKEMIVRGGRNIWPYELEQTVAGVPGIRRGCVAAFPATDPATGSERLVVLAETRETSSDGLARIRTAVQTQASNLLGLVPDEIILAPPHTVLKTSSGKIRRADLRTRYEEDRLAQGPKRVAWQVLRLVSSSVKLGLLRNARRLNETLYAGWAWCVFGLLVPPVWLSVVALPRLTWRWRAIRLAIRILRRLIGVELAVRGIQQLPPKDQPWVLTANHSSYLDALVLIDALPSDPVYAAKQELEEGFFARVFLQRLQTLFVERFDTRRSAVGAEAFAPRLRAGQSLVFFPEGTFQREPGLLPFRSGAFLAATEAAVPVVPVIIKGTRELLPAGTWKPRRVRLEAIIKQPLLPAEKGWSAAVHLREETRRVILDTLEEPDLG